MRNHCLLCDFKKLFFTILIINFTSISIIFIRPAHAFQYLNNFNNYLFLFVTFSSHRNHLSRTLLLPRSSNFDFRCYLFSAWFPTARVYVCNCNQILLLYKLIFYEFEFFPVIIESLFNLLFLFRTP